MDFKRLETTNVNDKTVLLRVDFNVPRHPDGTVSDETRILAALPTLEHLRKSGAKTIILSHFGRPKGQANPDMSLGFMTEVLSQKLGCPVGFSDNITPETSAQMSAGDVLLMENTRFHPGETKGDTDLSRRYAAMGDIFVQDAFSAAHRPHCSSAGIADFIPAYAGLAMARELDHLAQALEHPTAPVMAVVGGAKVSTKIDLLTSLVTQLDILVIGGGMANTFLAAQGHDVGKSLSEPDLAPLAREIIAKAEAAQCAIVLPIDVVVAKAFEANAVNRVCTPDAVASDEMILDAGPETVTAIADALDTAKTLIWNGPLGAFEIPPFDTSTVETARYAAKRAQNTDLIAVAGGGDTVAALNHANAADGFTFVSTAGGAFLEWMEGKALPGVEILKA